MPRARRPATGSEVIRFDKPKKKGCGGTCSGCKSGHGCDGKKGMRPAGRKHKEPDREPDMDRDDALSPQEYLDACDLGIVSYSRPYIRARLDAAARADAKCGNSGIAQGKQCRKGGGGAVSTIGKVAAGAGAIAGGVAAVRNRGAITKAVGAGAMKTAATAGGLYGRAQRTVGAVRKGGMTGMAAAAGKNTARAQNAIKKAPGQVKAAAKNTVGAVKQKAAPMVKSADYQRRNVMRTSTDKIKKMRTNSKTKQLGLF